MDDHSGMGVRARDYPGHQQVGGAAADRRNPVREGGSTGTQDHQAMGPSRPSTATRARASAGSTGDPPVFATA
ncbi:hypothetical protein GCM10010466_07800 [Planomonospora alba]|uniref:Uncharacterized protein n=1 Tax=Planomonospora alba TaxID=161354 RepID=A0ABP6MN64_9ACTN